MIIFFLFSQKWFKENITWHTNGTMSYSSRKEFTFMLDLSVGDHRTDHITTVNVPVASAYYQKRSSEYIKWPESYKVIRSGFFMKKNPVFRGKSIK